MRGQAMGMDVMMEEASIAVTLGITAMHSRTKDSPSDHTAGLLEGHLLLIRPPLRASVVVAAQTRCATKRCCMTLSFFGS